MYEFNFFFCIVAAINDKSAVVWLTSWKQAITRTNDDQNL